MSSLVLAAAQGGVNSNLFVVIAVSGVFYGTPLALAALGEMLAERSGVLNLGVEGMMLMGALAAAWTSLNVSGPGWVVVLLALLAAAAMAAWWPCSTPCS
ncbi:MAG TPA: hypothetical protein PKE56_10375 [Acidimicrobiales bacterium]|nr:hypothetical protein [Acidimicrobiales bacterium]